MKQKASKVKRKNLAPFASANWVLTTARFPHVGGMSVHIEQFLEQARRRGLRYNVRSFPELGHSQAHASGGSSKASGLPTLLKLIFKFFWAAISFRGIKGCTVICHDPVAILAARLWSPVQGILVVHGELANEVVALGVGPESPIISFVAWLEKKAYDSATKVIAVDRRLANHVQSVSAKHSARTDSLKIIWNGVAPPDALEAPRPKRDQISIVIARRLVPKNGVVYALRALREVSFFRPNIKLSVKVFGSGSEAQGLHEEFSDCNFIEWMGDRGNGEVMEALRAAHIAVVPSVPVGAYVEATSLSATEACMSGCALVASNVGGLAEMLVHNQTALLTQPGNVTELQAAFIKLVDDETYRLTLAQNGQAWATENMTSSAHFESVLNFITQERQP